MLPVVLVLAAQAACPSAVDLEAALNKAQVSPFTADIKPVGLPAGRITPTGGFRVAATPIGEIVWQFSPMAEFDTACGSRITWTPAWTGGHISNATHFAVQAAPMLPPPANTFADLIYRVAPEGEGSRLIVEKAGRPIAEYRVNFRATALSLLPELHRPVLRLDLIGVQSDGAILFAEFSAFQPETP